MTLRKRIRGGESAVLEFKTTAPEPRRLARTLAAFANGAGGELFIGINDRGEVVGVEDAAAERVALEAALEFVDPCPRVRFETLEHQLKTVVAASVEVLEFPAFCHVVDGEETTLYFRIKSQSRPVDRRVEKSVVRLRRHYGRAGGSLDDDERRLLDWLWDVGEAKEGVCARKLNYSSRRLRKLAEGLIGAGYLVPCNIGDGRSYAAIHPGPHHLR